MLQNSHRATCPELATGNLKPKSQLETLNLKLKPPIGRFVPNWLREVPPRSVYSLASGHQPQTPKNKKAETLSDSGFGLSQCYRPLSER